MIRYIVIFFFIKIATQYDVNNNKTKPCVLSEYASVAGGNSHTTVFVGWVIDG